MIKIGLTGSIGMGKSTTARFFAEAGIPVNDADEVVHRLYRGRAVEPIERLFGDVVSAGEIDRASLAAKLAMSPASFQDLEAIVHPLVRQEEERFVLEKRNAGADMVVLDIPLLFESGADERVDVKVVASCNAELQRQRVLARPGMTEEKFKMITARQLPDEEKRRRADFVVDTGQGFEHARAIVHDIISTLRTQGKELPMREVVFDTETTGLEFKLDRVIEIGGVELLNGFPTGRSFHVYINPGDRKIHPDALAVHGITEEFLRDKPLFADIVPELQTFFDGAHWVAHNANFDMNFINAEFERLGIEPVPSDMVVDTLALARRKHPMGPNSLDALCRRYGIDNSHRTKHGALLDSELLAEVYIEMRGGRQAALGLSVATSQTPAENQENDSDAVIVIGSRPKTLSPRLSDEELEAREQMLVRLGQKAIWNAYQ